MNVVDEKDPCQPCHNSLWCLAWSREWYKAKCKHWAYFKKHYASGDKKLIGAEILDELPEPPREGV